MQKMKVLLVTYHFLSGSGGGIFASRGFINALCEIYGSLTLICPVSSGEAPKGLDPRVRIIAIEDKRSPLKKFFDYLRAHFTAFRKPFVELMSKEDFDLLVFDNCNASSGLIELAKKSSAKVVTIHHNWQYAFEKDNGSWPMRLITVPAVRWVEGNAVRNSDFNITLTEQDRESLYAAYDKSRSARIEVCPPFEYQ